MVDTIHKLKTYCVVVCITDPQVDPEEAKHECGVRLIPFEGLQRADAVVAAVAHKGYVSLSAEKLGRRLSKRGAFIDVKAAFDTNDLITAGMRIWRL